MLNLHVTCKLSLAMRLRNWFDFAPTAAQAISCNRCNVHSSDTGSAIAWFASIMVALNKKMTNTPKECWRKYFVPYKCCMSKNACYCLQYKHICSKCNEQLQAMTTQTILAIVITNASCMCTCVRVLHARMYFVHSGTTTTTVLKGCVGTQSYWCSTDAHPTL